VDIILNNVYNHEELTPPDIPSEELRRLLIICTTKTPFVDPFGGMYVQCGGVSMGSALGPTFAEYYMCELENKVFADYPELKPLIYTRYVDDCFVLVRDVQSLLDVKSKFEEQSVLSFTYETESSSKLAFLDILINRRQDNFETTVYVKSTNSGDCLNYRSVCPDRYKVGVIKTLLHRGLQICNDWNNFHQEVLRIKQLLTNNNFPMRVIDDTVNEFLNKVLKPGDFVSDKQEISIYYENQMSSNYKLEEKRIRTIIADNVVPTSDDDRVNLIIYYQNRKLKNLLIKNSPQRNNNIADQHNVVYQYICDNAGCNPSQDYIGYTTCTVADRFRMHAVNGSIKRHLVEQHNLQRVTKAQLMAGVKILRRCNTKRELVMTEAVLIKELRPKLNAQDEGAERVLKIFKH